MDDPEELIKELAMEILTSDNDIIRMTNGIGIACIIALTKLQGDKNTFAAAVNKIVLAFPS